LPKRLSIRTINVPNGRSKAAWSDEQVIRGGSIMPVQKSRVAFLKTEDRRSGVELSIKALGINTVKGKAVLKSLGSNAQIMRPRVFEQPQLARAVALGLGASSGREIDLFAADGQSRQYRDRIAEILMAS